MRRLSVGLIVIHLQIMCECVWHRLRAYIIVILIITQCIYMGATEDVYFRNMRGCIYFRPSKVDE